jgi:hypothetical protein
MPELTGNNLVEKSKALVWAKFTDYTAGELRLLEVYLSRINPRDPESSNVSFTLAEYCKLLDLKLNSKNLKSQVKHFLGNVVSVPLNTDGTEYVMYPLFTKAEVKFNRESLSYDVSINCNPDLRPVFFDIARSGYVKYRLRYTIGMKQQASILMYSMIRDWMNRSLTSNKIGLKQLRDHLGANDASYDDFRALRRRVLEPAVEEISNVSDIVVDFEKICTGRKVVAVEFRFGYKSKQPVIDADSSEVDCETANSKPEIKKAARKPCTSGYEDFDWSVCDELEKQDCIDVAKVVEKWMKKEHPEIKLPRRREAVYETVKAAYNDILSLDRSPFPDRPVGYLIRSVDKAGIVDRYMPAFYSIEALSSK